MKATPSGFCAPIGLSTQGRYAIEVLGTGPSGPEVAALFSVDVGDVLPKTDNASPNAPRAAPSSPAEPNSLVEARAALLLRINGLRAANGVASVSADARLDAVAQAYAERVGPGALLRPRRPGGGLPRPSGLRAAGYPFSANGENLGRAGPGPLSAHASVEESPGHRRNLLLPVFSRLGVGVAVETIGGRNQTLVVEVLAAPDTRALDPVGDAYRRIAEQRAALGLPTLARSPQLEVVATEQARIALDADDPHTERLLAPERLHARVAESLQGVASTSAELFVAEDLSQAAEDARGRRREEEFGGGGSRPRPARGQAARRRTGWWSSTRTAASAVGPRRR